MPVYGPAGLGHTPMFLNTEHSGFPYAVRGRGHDGSGQGTALFGDPVGQSAGVWTPLWGDDFSLAMSVVDGPNGIVNFGGSGNWKAWYDDALAAPLNGHSNNAGRELQYYDTTALSVSSSVLSLTATYSPGTSGSHGGANYVSGMVSTSPSCNFKYGYIEARIKCAGAIGGQWPAFWMIPSDHTWPPEVDIMEQFGTNNLGKTTTWVNNSGPGGTVGSLNLASSGADMTAFHVFGCKWNSTTLTFYVDGSQYAQETTVGNVPQKNMYVVLDLAIDGNQTFTAGSGYPTSFQADYVRVWQ